MTKRVNNAHCRLRRAAIFLRYRDELTGLRDVDGQMDQDLFEARRVTRTHGGNQAKTRKREQKSTARAAGNTSIVITMSSLSADTFSGRIDVSQLLHNINIRILNIVIRKSEIKTHEYTYIIFSSSSDQLG